MGISFMSVYMFHILEHLTYLDEAYCFMNIFEDDRENPFIKINLTCEGKGETIPVTGREGL
jgi:hypothetical protein